MAQLFGCVAAPTNNQWAHALVASTASLAVVPYANLELLIIMNNCVFAKCTLSWLSRGMDPAVCSFMSTKAEVRAADQTSWHRSPYFV